MSKNVHCELNYNRLGEILYVLHKNNRKFLNDSLKKHDLTLLQAMCILVIHEKRNITQQYLTEQYFISKSAITKALSKLEVQKYITRKISKEDGRQYDLELTKKGERIIPVLKEINSKWETTMGLDELDEEFTEKLYNLAEKSMNLNAESD